MAEGVSTNFNSIYHYRFAGQLYCVFHAHVMGFAVYNDDDRTCKG